MNIAYSIGSKTANLQIVLNVRVKCRQNNSHYSSRFSKHETYVNGVKQESKSKFRAFMEYKGLFICLFFVN